MDDCHYHHTIIIITKNSGSGDTGTCSSGTFSPSIPFTSDQNQIFHVRKSSAKREQKPSDNDAEIQSLHHRHHITIIVSYTGEKGQRCDMPALNGRIDKQLTATKIL